jgi:hypothetical protein
LHPGRFTLGFDAAGSARYHVDVDLRAADTEDLRVEMPTVPLLRVRVLDESGRPAPSVALLAFGPDAEPAGKRPTDEEGRAAFPAPSPGPWAVGWDSHALRASAWPHGRTKDGAAAPPASAVVVVGDGDPPEVTLRLPPLACVRGRLRIGDSVAAVRLVHLEQGDTDGLPLVSATTDDTGAFVFPRVEVGEYRFRVAGYRHDLGVPPIPVVVPEAVDREVDVSLPEPRPQPVTPSDGKCG